MAYTEQQARELVIEAGHRLLANRLIARTWGNISARISATQFIITPSGRAYDTLKPEDLVKVTVTDGSYEGHYKPSSEKGIHVAAYQLRDDVDFIIHTHQFYASAICAAGEDTSFAPCAAYGLPGTKRLKQAVARTIRDNPTNNAFLMARHGALCLGKSLDDAFAVAEALEQQCRALFESRVPVNHDRFDGSFDVTELKNLPFARWETDSFILSCSRRGLKVPAYIDDFAQMIGPRIEVCRAAPASAARQLKKCDAVLLKGCGAVCSADTADDAEAVAMILSKNCAAALYVQDAKPLPPIDALLQRMVYLKKYSKQRDA